MTKRIILLELGIVARLLFRDAPIVGVNGGNFEQIERVLQ